MIGKPGEDVAQVGFRIEAVELCGLDQRVDGSGSLAAGVRAGEQIVLAAQSERPDGAFGGVVVDLQSTVVEVAGERRPACKRIADGRREISLGRELRPD